MSKFLLKDVHVETFRTNVEVGGLSTGKFESAVRMIHLPTGITVECAIYGAAYRNRQIALDMLREKVEAHE